MTQLQEHLEKINACQEACEWAGKRTPQEAWDQCKRADWLLWWAWTVRRDSRPPLIRATCCGPRRALRFVPAGELRPLRAIEAAEAVAENDTPELRAAAGVAARGDWAARGARAARAAAYAARVASEVTEDASSYAARAARAAAHAAAGHVAICSEIRAILQCPFGGAK